MNLRFREIQFSPRQLQILETVGGLLLFAFSFNIVAINGFSLY